MEYTAFARTWFLDPKKPALGRYPSRWKFDRSDIEGWKLRDKYQAYAEEALAATHTKEAPWFIVPGDRKPEARAIVAALVAEVLKSLGPDYPEEHPDVLEEYRTLLAENGVE
ncbi:MAG: hypothetical protein LPK06_01385 [Marinobacter sp.]|nr:hypothetical protein [Marinobacter sp.]